MYFIAFIFGLIGASRAQYVSSGQCADKTVQVEENFNLTAFSGRWYVIVTHTRLETCSTVDLTSTGDVTFNITLNQENVFGCLSTSARTAEWSGSLNNTGLIVVNHLNSNSVNWRIVSTDYTNYAITYNCEDFNRSSKSESVWVLSRSRSLAASANTTAENVLSEQNITGGRFNFIDQSNCPETIGIC